MANLEGVFQILAVKALHKSENMISESSKIKCDQYSFIGFVYLRYINIYVYFCLKIGIPGNVYPVIP